MSYSKWRLVPEGVFEKIRETIESPAPQFPSVRKALGLLGLTFDEVSVHMKRLPYPSLLIFKSESDSMTATDRNSLCEVIMQNLEKHGIGIPVFVLAKDDRLEGFDLSRSNLVTLVLDHILPNNELRQIQDDVNKTLERLVIINQMGFPYKPACLVLQGGIRLQNHSIQPDQIVVLRTEAVYTADVGERVKDEMKEALKKIMLGDLPVVFLEGGVSLETVDETTMREQGWTRIK